MRIHAWEFKSYESQSSPISAARGCQSGDDKIDDAHEGFLFEKIEHGNPFTRLHGYEECCVNCLQSDTMRADSAIVLLLLQCGSLILSVHADSETVVTTQVGVLQGAITGIPRVQ